MKKIVKGEELQAKMVEAINLLCDTVKTTLGPKGSNVIIDHSLLTPYITNDGVTIAENIVSDDPVINTILELAKEASISTQMIVGDGTTTTLVLLQGLYNYGLEFVNKGINPITIKQELESVAPKVVEMVKKYAFKPRERELKKIATIAASSEEIGSIVSSAYLKVASSAAINVVDKDIEKTNVIYQKGYVFDTIMPSNYFFKGKNSIELSNPAVIIYKNYLSGLENIASLLNELLEQRKPFIIFADGFDEAVINQLLSWYLSDDIPVIPLSLPGYSKEKLSFISDLSVIGDMTELDMALSIGHVEKCLIKNDVTELQFNENSKITSYVASLKENLDKDFEEDEQLGRRIAGLSTGIITIEVGAKTKTERREMKMRFDDALCALSSSREGVMPGGGISFYDIALKMEDDSIGKTVITHALKEPLKQIMINAGLDYRDIVAEMEKANFKKLYNIQNNCYEKVDDTMVIDSLKVQESAFLNAISIAGMLLTTTSLIINEAPLANKEVNTFNDL